MAEDDPMFVRSFTVAERLGEDAQVFFREFGFIAFRDVLTSGECDVGRHAMWNILERVGPSFSRHDEATWGSKWPTNPYGMMGDHGQRKGLPTMDPSLLRLRTHRNVHACFAAVLGEEDLVCNHDRILMTRPGGRRGHEDWLLERGREAVLSKGLHLDLCPWDYDNQVRCNKRMKELDYRSTGDFVAENNLVHRGLGLTVQGLLNLDECPHDNGGTVVVPGSHRVFDQVLDAIRESGKENMRTRATQYAFTSATGLAPSAIRVPQHEGTLLIFDQRVVHSGSVNRGQRWRYALPVRYLQRAQVKNQSKRNANRKACAARLFGHLAIPDPSTLLEEERDAEIARVRRILHLI